MSINKTIFGTLAALFAAFIMSSCSDDIDLGDSNQTTIEASSLPRASTATVETYFSGATITTAKKSNTANIYGSIYSALLSNGFEIDFNEQGLWTEIESEKDMAIPDQFLDGELPTIFAYLNANYPDNFVVEIERERSGYTVELNNGVDLVFDQEQNFIGIDLDEDDDDEVRIAYEELPENSRNFITANFEGATAITVKKETDNRVVSYDVYLDNGVKIEFNQDGNWVEMESKRNQDLPMSILPQNVAEYIAQNYRGFVLTEVEIESNGRYSLELVNRITRQDVELEFDANGNFIREDN